MSCSLLTCSCCRVEQSRLESLRLFDLNRTRFRLTARNRFLLHHYPHPKSQPIRWWLTSRMGSVSPVDLPSRHKSVVRNPSLLESRSNVERLLARVRSGPLTRSSLQRPLFTDRCTRWSHNPRSAFNPLVPPTNRRSFAIGS